MIPTLIEVAKAPSSTSITALTPTVGSWPATTDLDIALSLSWSSQGLRIVADITDNVANPQPGREDLWRGDSVELFLGTKVGEAQYVQFLISAYKGAVVEADHRSKVLGPLQCRARSGARAVGYPSGYVLIATLGWAQLGIVPKHGTELAFQIVVNDRDKDGTTRQFGLHPGGSAYDDPRKMVRLKLSERPVSRHADLAIEADYTRFPKTVVTITGPAGRAVEIRDKFGVLATGAIRPSEGRGATTLTLTRAWDPASVEAAYGVRPWLPAPGKGSPILLENPTDIRARRLTDAKLSFSSFVFTESTFPTPEVSERLEAALGGVSLTTTFYDASQKPVTQPKSPGRYGAVTRLTGKSGLARTFFTTLYRAPGTHDPWQRPNFFAGRIPEELGVAPSVSQEHQAEIAEFLRDRFLAHLTDDPKSAILLSGLAECRPSEPAVARLSPEARNNRWWHALQTTLGLAPRFRYAVQLPTGYDTDKTKRWPLLLFLHGSGESGENLERVKVHGPWKHTQEFVIVAPQNPTGDWWQPEQVLALVDTLEKTYRLDRTRLYLTGLSLGGFGTWATALEAPKRFAAIVPICGVGDPADAARLTALPTWAFHGVRDDAVPVRHSQEMIAALQKAGAQDARLTLYPELGHDVWSTSYAQPALYAWLLSHRSGNP